MTKREPLTRQASPTSVRPVPNDPESPWFSTPNALRHRKNLCLTISDEERKELERVAHKHGVALSRAVVAAFALLRGRSESEIAEAMRAADDAAPKGGRRVRRKR